MSIHIDHTGAFANFWNREFPDLQCPPVPKKESDLNMTARETLRISDPVLFQNLFSNGGIGSTPLPADTQHRRATNQLSESDIPHLRAAGLEWEAQQLGQQVQRQQDQRLADQAAAEAAANKEQKAFYKQWNNASFGERLAMSGGPTPQAIAQARKMWGITGQ